MQSAGLASATRQSISRFSESKGIENVVNTMQVWIRPSSAFPISKQLNLLCLYDFPYKAHCQLLAFSYHDNEGEEKGAEGTRYPLEHSKGHTTLKIFVF